MTFPARRRAPALQSENQAELETYFRTFVRRLVLVLALVFPVAVARWPRIAAAMKAANNGCARFGFD